MIRRIDSGSSCSPSEVEPVTSQKRIVTVLRNSPVLTCDETGSLATAIVLTFVWVSPGRAVPHTWQNRADVVRRREDPVSHVGKDDVAERDARKHERLS